MLERTFIHIPGVGRTIETQLWQNGCTSWDDALSGINEFSFGSAPTPVVAQHLEKSKRSLEQKEHQYFAQTLGLKEAWRAWPEFRSSCTYVDIETDGGRSGNSITTIGCWNGSEFDVFVKHQNLENFRDYISHYSMIVTFFGASFDIPMILKKFHNLRIDQIHLDLCPTLRSVGFQGGLKKIEKQVGINRGEDTDGLTGFDAIKLWRRYTMNRDQKALETLIAYNREDVVNLETLAQIAYDRHKAATFDAAILETNAPK